MKDVLGNQLNVENVSCLSVCIRACFLKAVLEPKWLHWCSERVLTDVRDETSM